ncbi:MAG: glycosyltransferase, partial [Cyanobacteria bacterium J06623_7]
LLHTQGKYITFKDSDDWSHPQLLEAQIKILQNPGLKAVASGFIRIDQESNIEFKPEKPLNLAHITLCIKRDPVFKTIGFFDAVRAIADTEYINRIKLIWGANAVEVVDSPLLIMTRSKQSITGGGKLSLRWHGDRPICLRYWHDARKWHRIMSANQIDPYLPHPLDYRRFDVDEELLS